MSSKYHDSHQRKTRHLCALIIGVAWWNPLILIAHPQFKAPNPQFWTLNSPSSYLKSPLSNLILHPQLFFHNPKTKRMGYLPKNVLKISGCETKCTQALLAKLAAFSGLLPSSAKYPASAHLILPSSVPVPSSTIWNEISLKFEYYPPTCHPNPGK